MSADSGPTHSPPIVSPLSKGQPVGESPESVASFRCNHPERILNATAEVYRCGAPNDCHAVVGFFPINCLDLGTKRSHDICPSCHAPVCWQ